MKNILKVAVVALSFCLFACTDSTEVRMVHVGTPYEAPYMDIENMDKEQVLSLSYAELEVYLKNAFPVIENSYNISEIIMKNEPEGSRKYKISRLHKFYILKYFANTQKLKNESDATGRELSVEEMFVPMVDAYQVSAEYLKLLDEIDTVEGEL